MFPDTPPLMPGTDTPDGRIEAVGVTGGERYYWLLDRDGAVKMLPWFMVERRTDRETAP